ncbi:Uma2 family endonuclease [Dapis sp. BLCC M229]|uniref:Uma2 family endonuclease n=1 Tax=Dapis sp. BLCC M229 TaxID=3400188 RepID=UPI003CEB0D08
MTAESQIQRMTPEEYLAWEEKQPMKYEYLNGKVYGMTRETLPHNDIALNLASALKSHLQGKSCKVQIADTKVGVSSNGLFFYPDIVVSCDPRDRESRNIIYYPCLIVEVLSSTTEAFDPAQKFQHYRQIESLKEYVLIDSEKICIEYYQINEKNKWELTTYSVEEIADSQQEFSVKLESINFEFTTSLLYENVVFPEKINLEKERIENPKQQDFSSAEDIQASEKETPEKQTRLIRRIADWWVTTPIEKFFEDIDYLLKNVAILDVVSLLANITLILILLSWLTEFKERKEQRHFSTWSVINEGQGDKSGVVTTALERLNKEGFSLSGLQLNKTNLHDANLNGARLFQANFSEAILSRVKLTKANLVLVNLSQVFFIGADLNEAYLNGANLSKANMIGINFTEADLGGTNLSEADFDSANLDGANLRGTYLFNAKNLSNAQIKLGCNWKEATYVKSTIQANNIDTLFEENLMPKI